ncbi:MAG: dTDP-4-dehydrorhamnose 3,5-epimerase [Desulfuromonadales bacterium]
MKMMRTEIPDVLLFEPQVFGDSRGFFVETFRRSWLEEAGLSVRFVQDNQSRSRRGVLRGLHYQLEQPQGKLVRCARGRVFDVAVDVRRGSPTFGRWVGALLDDENHRQLYIPPGLAHGFVVLSDTADFLYKCTTYYHPQSEAGILWNDPDIGIEWPKDILDAVVLSEKDRTLPALQNQPEDRLPALAENGNKYLTSSH